MALEIKICGLTHAEDARLAAEEGADYLGFVLYPKSPRFVPPAVLSRLIRQLPPGARGVGVFVNMPGTEVERIAREAGLFAVQIHGDEPADDFQNFPIPVWRAVRRVGSQWQPDPDRWPAERYVVDAAVHGAYGGSGSLADWDSAATLARRVTLMLAGGLTASNVAEAIRSVHPAGLDVCSGVEASPGRKDPAKLRTFVQAVRAAQPTR